MKYIQSDTTENQKQRLKISKHLNYIFPVETQSLLSTSSTAMLKGQTLLFFEGSHLIQYEVEFWMLSIWKG